MPESQPGGSDIAAAVRRLKHTFFAHRNGILADALRRAGQPHRYVMGCNLADIAAIAATEQRDAALALALWNEHDHRECRLAATMLYPPEQMTADRARRWADDVITAEEADVLCHRLLRRTPFAPTLWREMLAAPSAATWHHYTALRLLQGLLAIDREPASAQARETLNSLTPDTLPPSARTLLSTILSDFE